LSKGGKGDHRGEAEQSRTKIEGAFLDTARGRVYIEKKRKPENEFIKRKGGRGFHKGRRPEQNQGNGVSERTKAAEEGWGRKECFFLYARA